MVNHLAELSFWMYECKVLGAEKLGHANFDTKLRELDEAALEICYQKSYKEKYFSSGTH